jgi:hypothetical protein
MMAELEAICDAARQPKPGRSTVTLVQRDEEFEE